MIAEVMKDGFLDRHVPTIRALYKSQRDAMLAALAARDDGLDVQLEHARRRHVPVGAPAARHERRRRCCPKPSTKTWPSCRARRSTPTRPMRARLRLSFVTASVEQIDTGVAALAAAIREQPAAREG